MSEERLRPIKPFVLLVDDQPEMNDKGIIVRPKFGTYHMDFLVADTGNNEGLDFGVGDRVILCDPNAGRRVYVGGIVHRLVSISDILATID